MEINRNNGQINLAGLTGFFKKLGWETETLDEATLGAVFEVGALVFPLTARLTDDFVFFAVSPFRDMALKPETDFLRLLQLNEQAPVVKVSVTGERHLLTSIELEKSWLNYETFESAVAMLVGFTEEYFQEMYLSVKLEDSEDGAEAVE